MSFFCFHAPKRSSYSLEILVVQLPLVHQFSPDWRQKHSSQSVIPFAMPRRNTQQWFINQNEMTTWLGIIKPQGSRCLNTVMTLIVYSWVWEYKYSIYNKTDANVSHKSLAAPSRPMKKRTICIIGLFQIDFHAHVDAAKPHNKQKRNKKWTIIPAGLLNPISQVDHPDPEETGKISPWACSRFQLWKLIEILLSGWIFKWDTDFNTDVWKTETVYNMVSVLDQNLVGQIS